MNEVENITEQDLNDILEDNGFNENQGEGTDIDIETSREEFNQALDEAVETAAQEFDSTKIPANSPSLLIDESTTRFSGAEWFQAIQKTKIILAGVGGIGRI